MKKNNFFLICCSLFFLLLAACNTTNKKQNAETQKASTAAELEHTARTTDSVMKVLEQQEAERLKNVTSIQFDKEVYNFGECTEGDKVNKTIEFTNTGKLPLVIEQAYGSCGCTIPTYDKEPIQPGKKGKLNIEFNSANKAGANTKAVTVIANTNPPTTEISFSIKVKKKK